MAERKGRQEEEDEGTTQVKFKEADFPSAVSRTSPPAFLGVGGGGWG